MCRPPPTPPAVWTLDPVGFVLFTLLVQASDTAARIPFGGEHGHNGRRGDLGRRRGRGDCAVESTAHRAPGRPSAGPGARGTLA